MVDSYTNWKKEKQTCSKCNWTGSGNELVAGKIYKEMFEMNCPQCNQWLVVNMNSVMQGWLDSRFVRRRTRLAVNLEEKRTNREKPGESRREPKQASGLGSLLHRVLGPLRSNLGDLFQRWVDLRLNYHTGNIYLPANKRSHFKK